MPRPRTAGFTATETRVLELLKDGTPNKSIARELGLAEATIKVHVKNIIAKIGVTNRTQVALWVHQNLGAGAAIQRSATLSSVFLEPVRAAIATLRAEADRLELMLALLEGAPVVEDRAA